MPEIDLAVVESQALNLLLRPESVTPWLLRRRPHQAPYHFDPLQLVRPTGQIRVREREPAQPNEGPHDLGVDRDGPWAP